MQPLSKVPKPDTKLWFKNVPVGVNRLKCLVSKIATLSSLIATSASRVFAKFTGHKSVKELRQYERTSVAQQQAAGLAISTGSLPVYEE